jgi:hypothetical protein
VKETGRVGAAGNEAQHLAAGLDQLVPADVRLDAREKLQASQGRRRRVDRCRPRRAPVPPSVGGCLAGRPADEKERHEQRQASSHNRTVRYSSAFVIPTDS